MIILEKEEGNRIFKSNLTSLALKVLSALLLVGTICYTVSITKHGVESAKAACPESTNSPKTALLLSKLNVLTDIELKKFEKEHGVMVLADQIYYPVSSNESRIETLACSSIISATSIFIYKKAPRDDVFGNVNVAYGLADTCEKNAEKLLKDL